jgi:phospho-N-acetylmuramoyl-pentapeptide-transferase
LAIPFFKGWLVNLGWLWIPFAMLVIVGASNAVNLTDGLDGLAHRPGHHGRRAFGVIAYLTGNFRAADYLKILNVRGAGELTVFCGALIGAAIGFLWFQLPSGRDLHGRRGLAGARRRDRHAGGAHEGRASAAADRRASTSWKRLRSSSRSRASS